MEYLASNFQSFLAQFDFNNLMQKCIISVLILVVVFISFKIIFRVIDRVFDENRANLEPREVRRVITLNNVTKTAIRASIWTAAALIILGQ
ncbi:MAG: mechanosensitive ion channel family protein, partial [Acetobacterium sp.]|nr:mechanosensitive ion channel family protein [Acetobacterium sp.]